MSIRWAQSGVAVAGAGGNTSGQLVGIALVCDTLASTTVREDPSATDTNLATRASLADAGAGTSRAINTGYGAFWAQWTDTFAVTLGENLVTDAQILISIRATANTTLRIGDTTRLLFNSTGGNGLLGGRSMN